MTTPTGTVWRQSNEPDEIRDWLFAALAVVEELDPPADLRPIAFAKAADLYSAKLLVPSEAAQLVADPRVQLR